RGLLDARAAQPLDHDEQRLLDQVFEQSAVTARAPAQDDAQTRLELPDEFAFRGDIAVFDAACQFAAGNEVHIVCHPGTWYWWSAPADSATVRRRGILRAGRNPCSRHIGAAATAVRCDSRRISTWPSPPTAATAPSAPGTATGPRSSRPAP